MLYVGKVSNRNVMIAVQEKVVLFFFRVNHTLRYIIRWTAPIEPSDWSIACCGSILKSTVTCVLPSVVPLGRRAEALAKIAEKNAPCG